MEAELGKMKKSSSCMTTVLVYLVLAASAGATVIQPTVLAAAAPPRPAPRAYCAPISRAIPKNSRCFRHLLAPDNGEAKEKEEEELVYVRLETLGARLDQLRTTPINELVAVGVFGQLFGTDARDNAGAPIKAQLWGPTAAEGAEERRLAQACRSAMERFLCRLAYPSCHFRRRDVGALVRPPCREDCLLLRDVLCPNLDWAQFAGQLVRALNVSLADLSAAGPALAEGVTQVDEPAGPNLAPSLHLYWPHERSVGRCELLPPLRAVPPELESFPQRARRHHHHHQLKWPVCSNAHLTLAGLQAPKVDCVGAHYQGHANRTASGLQCQWWQSQAPHEHTSSELLFEHMRDARNYCRNPGGLELRPWCYTLDPKVRWQYCDTQQAC